jgi:uncharacterized OsmC-like protein
MSPTSSTKSPTLADAILNGIDTTALRATVAAVKADPAKGQTHWRVRTQWKGGTRSDTRVTGYRIGGQEVAKDFTIQADEPLELCGTNKAPNPQELLLASLNACMTVGYVAACALEGITLESLSIETSGDIDLRGFLALDASVKPGYDRLDVVVSVRAKASPEAIQKVHEHVARTSPNRFNITQPVRVETRLVNG